MSENPKHWWDMQQGRIKRAKSDPDPVQAFKSAVKLGAVKGDEMPPLKASWADVNAWLKAREPLLPKAPVEKPVVKAAEKKPAAKSRKKPAPAPVAMAPNPAPVPEPAAPATPVVEKPKKKRQPKKAATQNPVPPPGYVPQPYPYYPPPYGYGFAPPPPPMQLAPNPAPAPVMENPAACGCVWEESVHEREARRVRARALGEWIEEVRKLVPSGTDWSARWTVQAFESGTTPEEFAAKLRGQA